MPVWSRDSCARDLCRHCDVTSEFYPRITSTRSTCSGQFRHNHHTIFTSNPWPSSTFFHLRVGLYRAYFLYSSKVSMACIVTNFIGKFGVKPCCRKLFDKSQDIAAISFVGYYKIFPCKLHSILPIFVVQLPHNSVVMPPFFKRTPLQWRCRNIGCMALELLQK